MMTMIMVEDMEGEGTVVEATEVEAMEVEDTEVEDTEVGATEEEGTVVEDMVVGVVVDMVEVMAVMEKLCHIKVLFFTLATQ